MMTTTQQLLRIFKTEEKEALEYFSKISLGDKHELKFGFDRDSVSITFFITGKSHSKNLSISEKLDSLFEINTDLEKLNKYLTKVKKPIKFHFSPYLKINKGGEPQLYAARIGVEHLNN